MEEGVVIVIGFSFCCYFLKLGFTRLKPKTRKPFNHETEIVFGSEKYTIHAVL